MAPSAKKKRSRIRPIKRMKLDAVRNEMNVTPLVDVCLVLLIIFMVVTPLLARGKEVPLPKTLNHREEADKNQPIVAINADGELFFDKDKVADLDALQKRVQALWDSEGQEPRVFVKADRDLPYKKVYPLIMAVNEIGVTGVDLATNELRQDK